MHRICVRNGKGRGGGAAEGDSPPLPNGADKGGPFSGLKSVTP